jgi:succinate dehydrogenase hydrophobic anchor subunit
MNYNYLFALLEEGGTTGSNVYETLINGCADYITGIGTLLIMLLGVALLIIFAIRLYQYFKSGGRGDIVTPLLGLAVGGVLLLGAGDVILQGTLAKAGKATLDKIITAKSSALDSDVSVGGTPGEKGIGVILDHYIKPTGEAFTLIVGCILIILACYAVGNFIIKKQQPSWVKVIIMGLLGGAMYASAGKGEGWKFVREKLVKMTRATLSAIMGGADSDGDVYSVMKNAGSYLESIAGLLVVFIGLLLVFVAVMQIAKNLSSGGRTQVNWVVCLLALLVGGAFLVGGYGLLSGLASASKATLETATGGSSSTSGTPSP